IDIYSYKIALDGLLAIYKHSFEYAPVYQKVFDVNTTVQVVERHIIWGLENIFSPLVVSQ
ncbi:hypothetical protein GQ44DRAFT_604136, partial [Phaeosphaeriaceae sp. PMI808]